MSQNDEGGGENVVPKKEGGEGDGAISIKVKDQSGGEVRSGRRAPPAVQSGAPARGRFLASSGHGTRALGFVASDGRFSLHLAVREGSGRHRRPQRGCAACVALARCAGYSICLLD